VSSKGRLFFENRNRRSGTKGTGGGTAQVAPGTANVRFEGNRLVITRQYLRGAINVVVSFSSDFSTCSVTTAVGRLAAAPIKMRLYDGEIAEIVDASSSPAVVR
jgi:hypothetical protein